jgi:hypothetical protein
MVDLCFSSMKPQDHLVPRDLSNAVCFATLKWGNNNAKSHIHSLAIVSALFVHVPVIRFVDKLCYLLVGNYYPFSQNI